MGMKKNVGIVVVTFNPNLSDFEQNLCTYIAQVSTVVIVDNSTNEEFISKIYNLCLGYPSIKLIQFKDNLGIAYAQNIGIKYLIDNDYDFVIELDQDSKLVENYVDQIVEDFYVIRDTIDSEIIALGGLAINNNNGNVYEGFKQNVGFVKVSHTLSSGLLIHLNNLSNVGFKDERLFIDLVDWDWCWKATKKGYHTYVDTYLSVLHLMGEKHINFFSIKLGVPSPHRHYYAFRNSLYLLTQSHPPLKWKITVVPLLFFKILVYPLIMNNGLDRFRSMVSGLSDFCIKHYGKKRD
jgi:rhamnosyltransferase